MIYFRISLSFSIEELLKLKIDDTLELNIINSLSSSVLLKVGYCDDKERTINLRNKIYKTENPGLINYKFILGGTREDEFGIIEKFKSKRVTGREWFYLDQELFDFIKRVNTLEELREEIKYNLGKYDLPRKDIKHDLHITSLWVDSILDLLNLDIRNNYNEDRIFIENCLNELGFKLEKNDKIIDLVSSYFGIDSKQLKNRIYNNPIKNSKVTEFVNTFNQFGNSDEKLKILVEFIETISELDKNDLFSLIHPKYKNYIDILGIDKIRARSYHESLVRKELEKFVQNSNASDDLVSEIYKTFEVGKRYTKKEIKEALRQIFERVGYSGTPKATMLGDYFELKKIYITSTKENGFEILRKKH